MEDPSSNATRGATTRIPQNITSMFTSFTKSSTVASILDIQYRSWLPIASTNFDDGRPYLKGQFRHIDLLIPQNGVILREGIIADMKSGGIGYRNHTAPSGLIHGAEWEEDILWLEPDISCVKSNLSLELSLSGNLDMIRPLRPAELVDDGGFANMQSGNPLEDWPNSTYSLPDVRLLAERSTWLNNFLSAVVYNLTSFRQGSSNLHLPLGRHYPVRGGVSQFMERASVQTSLLGQAWLDIPFSVGDDGNLTIGNHTLGSTTDHPYEYALALAKDIDRRCSMADGRFPFKKFVHCGIFYGAQSRIDGKSYRIRDPGSKWKVPMHGCAGAVKARVKTVSFVRNGTESLPSVVVRSIKDKDYNDPPNYPLWAIEDWLYPGSEGAAIAPLWGIVDNIYENTPGFNFTRARSFYLPGVSTTSDWYVDPLPFDILAGTVVPFEALRQVMTTAFSSLGSYYSFPQYSGIDNAVLEDKWRVLSEQPGGPEILLRLVWTDIMASATVGTNLREHSTQLLSGSSAKTLRKATVFAHKITYDFRYAIPAALLLFSWVLLIIAAFSLTIIDKHLLNHLRELLNGTSLGRVAVGRINPRTGLSQPLSTRTWLHEQGHFQLRLRKDLVLDRTLGDAED
ncbi:hypothetical protein QQS21_010331 [Conoideocrella luteorostrata]|uniref:Uncharacterized protein n=1 Tax=Conoideocrella luteorostrata TaxID=1105319 RepID=A0AAJ0FUA3_9HYPO|nr:hypothetical protein QQS21_010331 [Conoideocrella luteorostrata]